MSNILIVEDDLDLVESYVDLLTAAGHSVTFVLRAAEAFRAISRNPPDLILLDLNLPGDSGLVVINFVRSWHMLRKCKIIVATGHIEMLKNSSMISNRVDQILEKPISNIELVEIITTLIKQPKDV